MNYPMGSNIPVTLAITSLLLLACLPWAVTFAFPPLVPEELAAAQRDYIRTHSQAVAPRGDAPTRTDVVVVGWAGVAMDIRKCPDNDTGTGRMLSPDVPFNVLGWSHQPDGSTWLLIRSDKGRDQEWIKSGPSINGIPADYQKYYSGPASCHE